MCQQCFMTGQQQKRRLRGEVLNSFVSGAIAGAVAKTTIAPLDRTKIYFQVTSKRYRFKKALRFLQTTYTNDGFSTLWRGNSATLVRVVPYAAIQFTSYEQYKILLSPDHSNKTLPPLRRFLAGSFAGMTATALTYPLDMIRARMAVTRSHTGRYLFQSLHSVFSNEGLHFMYRGIVPTLLGVFPYAGCSFFTYETLKGFYSQYYNEPPGQLFKLFAGAVAGLTGQSFSYPLDIVRRRMQTQGILTQVEYQSVLETFRYVLKTEGFRGLYKGVSMNWIKGPVAVTISFNTYEIVQQFLARHNVFGR